MKIKIIFFLTLAFIGFKTSIAQEKLPLHWDVEKISLTHWNTPDGLPYKQVPGANLGPISFASLDQQRIAFLSSPTCEIIIISTSDGKAIKTFPVKLAPRDFVYDKGLFYVLTESDITVYDESGKTINLFPFKKYYGVERLMRFNNSTYLWLPSGNSLKIESEAKTVAEEYSGWITSAGDFIVIDIQGDYNYYINLSRNNKTYETTLSTNKKVAGVYVIGSTENRLFFDVQTFLSENPIVIERHFVAVELNDSGIGSVITEIKVPDCYYIFSNKEIDLTPNAQLLNMVTSPDGVYIFSLNESDSKMIKTYPENLLEIKYHYNDHLINPEK
jgi:hypothetical protein